MKICFATKEDSENTINYFDKNLKKEDFWENYKEKFNEYFCPYWVRWAILREEVILLKNSENIIWALRFYPRKNSKIASLYQFAFDENIKKQKILYKMLDYTWYKVFQAKCTKDSKLNDYFEKLNWILIKSNKECNFYQLSL